MNHHKHAMCVVTALTALAFAAPSVASADTGSITSIIPLGNNQYQATFTSVSTSCPAIVYCGWFPYAVENSVSVPCYPHVDGDNRLVFVGDPTESGTETKTVTFFLSGVPARLCLYNAYGTSYADVFAGESVVEAPASPAPAPSPVPPPGPAPTTPTSTPPMTISEAKAEVPRILKNKYGSRFSKRTLRRSCSRWSESKVRCAVTWTKKPWRYSGSITMWNDPTDPAYYLYRYSIHRKRVRAHASVAEVAALRAQYRAHAIAVAAKSCSPGYTRGQIGGATKCLRRGEYCSKRYRRQYRRYGYRCVPTSSGWRLK